MLKMIRPARIASITRSQVSAFRSATAGIAAVEFAFVAPVLVFLFLATVEGSDALSTSRRVSLSANTLADLVAQETRVQKSDLDDLFLGMKDIIDYTPGSGNTIDYRVVSLVVDPSTDETIVHWSLDDQGNEPYTAGQKYTGDADVSLLDPNASIVVSEIAYAYQPTISRVLINSVNLKKNATRWPRRAFRVQLCTNVNDAATCTK